MSKVNWTWLHLTPDFWKLTITWLVSSCVIIGLKNLNMQFYVQLYNILFDLLKRYVLKDVGRMEEAIQCYNVCSFLILWPYKTYIVLEPLTKWSSWFMISYNETIIVVKVFDYLVLLGSKSNTCSNMFLLSNTMNEEH